MVNYKFKDKDSKRMSVLKMIRHPSKPINREKMKEVYESWRCRKRVPRTTGNLDWRFQRSCRRNGIRRIWATKPLGLSSRSRATRMENGSMDDQKWNKVWKKACCMWTWARSRSRRWRWGCMAIYWCWTWVAANSFPWILFLQHARRFNSWMLPTTTWNRSDKLAVPGSHQVHHLVFLDKSVITQDCPRSSPNFSTNSEAEPDPSPPCNQLATTNSRSPAPWANSSYRIIILPASHLSSSPAIQEFTCSTSAITNSEAWLICLNKWWKTIWVSLIYAYRTIPSWMLNKMAPSSCSWIPGWSSQPKWCSFRNIRRKLELAFTAVESVLAWKGRCHQQGTWI